MSPSPEIGLLNKMEKKIFFNFWHVLKEMQKHAFIK